MEKVRSLDLKITFLSYVLEVFIMKLRELTEV